LGSNENVLIHIKNGLQGSNLALEYWQDASGTLQLPVKYLT